MLDDKSLWSAEFEFKSGSLDSHAQIALGKGRHPSLLLQLWFEWQDRKEMATSCEKKNFPNQS